MDTGHHVVSLADLPAFTIRTVDAEGAEVVLAGVFNHLTSVRIGRAWLYKSNEESLEGDLVSMTVETLEARLLVAQEGLPSDVQPGASFPYFYGYFEPSVVDMILDPTRNWARVEYKPTDSLQFLREFVDGQILEEIEVGTPVPPGVRVLKTVVNGWSKERCTLCDERIGPEYQRCGYRSASCWCETI